MKNINSTCVALIAISIYSGSLTATTYTNNPLETPFDITLDTGDFSWSGNTPTLQSTDTTITVNHTSGSSNTAIVVEETPAEVGVEGAVDVYQVTNTTTSTHDHTFNDQTAQVSFNDSISTEQSTPSIYELSGTITTQPSENLYSSSGWLSFSLGLGVSFENNPGGVDGMLTFEFGSNPEAWGFSYTTEFTGLTDSIFLGDSEFLDLSNEIFFNAIYSITGSDGTPFDVSNISLGVNVRSEDDFAFNYTEPVTTETRLLLSHTVLPALQPPAAVPVPAAVWLMLSGLLGLTAVARRRRR